MHIYFSGIGGAGLSPLAQLALDCGYRVSGSDAAASLLTEVLEWRGITVTIGQSYDEIATAHERNPINWIVVSSALKIDHPHYQFAKDKNIKISKRHDLINLILQEKNLKLIAVAGTHGKTTTTAMIVWLFKQMNLPVSYSIGSNISFGPSAQYQPESEYFVYEADEFDRNFLNFKPYISLITSLDYDHPDTYPTQEEYFEAFRQFISQSKRIIAWDWDLSLIEDKKIVDLDKIQDQSKDLQRKIIMEDSRLLSFIEDNTEIFGLTNRHNASMAYSLLCYSYYRDYYSKRNFKEYIVRFDGQVESGEQFDEFKFKRLNFLNTFPGTQRRFEKLADNLYSDYAHHPTEIAATLQMAREVLSLQRPSPQTLSQEAREAKLIAIYQPHQNIRQHEQTVQQGYENCFDLADKVYWLPTYLSRENPDLEILSPKYLSGLVSKKDLVEVAELNQELAEKIKNHLAAGNLVVCLGAGSIDEWARKII
jgi:UDP-N-acetylmuramate--alanine ligase